MNESRAVRNYIDGDFTIMHTLTLRSTIAALFGALAVFIIPSFASAADLYVSTSGSDSNPGTQAAPFRTILKGSQMATPGTTVHVAPGTYTAAFRTTKSGTASARIRYVSDVKWGAKIAPTASSPSNLMIWDNRGNYVDIDGFDVSGSNCTACSGGIYLAGSYNTTKNSHVHHIATKACTSNGAGAIITDNYYGDVYNDAIGNVVDHVGPTGCNADHGIYMSTRGKVINNIVSNVSGWGIHLYHNATSVTIVNNTVFNNGSASAGGGMAIGGGGYYNGFTGPSDNNIVTNNTVFNNNSWGIIESGDSGTHSTYKNNLVFGHTKNWRLQNGLTHTGTVTANPAFVNYLANGTGDYHLAAGSPAINTGLNASYVPATDYDGVARPQGAAPDIGAYEYGGAPPPPPPPRGVLAGHWKFDETSGTSASDSSGNSLTGTVTNTTWTTGKIGNALALNGTTAYAAMGAPALLDFGTGDFTLSGWFYMDALPNAWTSIINKGASGAVGYGLEINSRNQLCGSIQSTGGTNQHACYGSPTTRVWHHASAVFTRNDKIYVYLDGVLLGSQTYSAGNTGSVDNSSAFTLGRYNSGTWYFNGKIDDVRVYNRALSATEVIDRYNNAGTRDTTPP